MKRKHNQTLLTVAATAVGLTIGAGIALAAHPNVPLYTYEEVGVQFGMGTKASPAAPPVMLFPNQQGLPYSPKMSCGTAGCHDYNTISDHAFHGGLGVLEWKDSSDGTFARTTQTRSKPWTQTGAMWGKW